MLSIVSYSYTRNAAVFTRDGETANYNFVYMKMKHVVLVHRGKVLYGHENMSRDCSKNEIKLLIYNARTVVLGKFEK